MSTAPLRRITAGLLLLAAVSLATPAGAQPSDDAVGQFEEASRLAREGQIQEAIDLWLAVFDALPDRYRSSAQLNLGLAYKKLGRFPEAWHYLSRYRILGPRNENADRWMQEVEAALAGGYRRVTLSCIPYGTMVAVSMDEGAPIHECPLTWWFAPGSHQVRLSRPGFKGAVKSIEVPEKQGEVRLSLTLEEETDGVLAIGGPAKGAKVFVAGKEVGEVPYQARLKAGKYEVRVVAKGEPPWEELVEVLPGRTASREPELRATVPVRPTRDDTMAVKAPRPGPASRWWKWALLGGGVALAATAAGLHVAAAQENADLRERYPDGTAAEPVSVRNRERYNERYDASVQPKAIGGYVLYGLGGAAVAAGLTVVILDLAGPSAKAEVMTTGLRPMPLPEGGGLSLDMTF
ncbi:MAG: PEGA domain-containing protein [Deltaproteobacteria bacterium]|nr:PEGA domain-containing protein [Deltaproteobacteria bacterium]